MLIKNKYLKKCVFSKRIIDVVFNINNQARDCRVRTYIPTNIASKFSVSDNQFGHIKRSVYDDAMEVWQQEEWSERPDSIYPMLTFVGLSDKEHGVAVLTNSTREFEIVEKKIAYFRFSNDRRYKNRFSNSYS